jgi:hypothetical protein
VAILAAVFLLAIGAVLFLTAQLLGFALLAAGLAIVWSLLRR